MRAARKGTGGGHTLGNFYLGSIKSSCHGPWSLQDRTHCGAHLSAVNPRLRGLLTSGASLSPPLPTPNPITNATLSPPPSLQGSPQINTPKPRMHRHQSQTRSQGHVWSEVADIKGFSPAASAHRQDAA